MEHLYSTTAGASQKCQSPILFCTQTNRIDKRTTSAVMHRPTRQSQPPRSEYTVAVSSRASLYSTSNHYLPEITQVFTSLLV